MSDLFEQGHACVIGVGGDLPSTVDDAKGFAKILKDPERCAYPESQVQVLTGEQATRANILNALETLASTTNAESTVLVYFSGHGYQLSGAIKSYFLIPHGYDSKDLSETAISGSEFVGLLRDIPAQKLLVLLDCCHAGGLSDLDGFQVAKAPLPPEATKLFAKGGGKMIIGSSMPDELSFAAKPYSVFTYALIKGLCGEGAVKKDGYVRATDLAMYASKIVPSLTSDKQHPVLDMEKADNFVLGYYAGGDLQPKGLPKELDKPLRTAFQEVFANQNFPSLTPTELKDAVCEFLGDIEANFQDLKLFHAPQKKVALAAQYIPIQVTLERIYQEKFNENFGSYAESEEGTKRLYAAKGEKYERKQEDWQEAKKEHQKIMVLADPGMGKSTLLRMEAGKLAQDERKKLSPSEEEGNPPQPPLEREESMTDESIEKIIDLIQFPLYLRLPDLAKGSGKIEDIILDLMKRDYPESAEKIEFLLRKKLKTGKCLLLLDALDEVPQDPKNLLGKTLNPFVKKFNHKTICTSRIVGYIAFLDDGKEMEIVPFTEKQTEEYIDIWFENAKAANVLENKDVSASGLTSEIKAKPQIQGLTQNPLLLSLVCSLYQTKGLEFPAKKTKVYEKAVDYMLSKWSADNQRLSSNEGWADSKKELLEFLAYKFSCKNTEVLYTRDLRKEIDQFKKNNDNSDFEGKNASDILKELSEQDGILQKLSENSDQYLFLHRTFQEYLTASYINEKIQKNQEKGIDLVKENFWQFDWYETISLVAGLMTNPLALLEAINQEADDIFNTLLLLAGLCISECQNNKYPLFKEIGCNIYHFWQSYPKARFISPIVEALAKTGNQQIVESLIKDFDNSDTWISYNAEKILAKIGWQYAVKSLIRDIDREKEFSKFNGNPNYLIIIKQLLKIENQQGIEALMKAFDNSDIIHCHGIAKALFDSNDPKAIEVLIKTLDHPNDNAKFFAAVELVKINNLKAINLILRCLYHSNHYVRTRAIIALEESGAINELEEDRRQQLVKALVEFKNYSECHIEFGFQTNSVLTLLAKLGDQQAIEQMFKELLEDNSHFEYARVLIEIGNQQAVSALIEALDHSNEVVRIRAALALVDIETRSIEAAKLIEEALVQALDHSQEEIRIIAAAKLIKVGNQKAVSILIETFAKSDNDDSIDYAGKALTSTEVGSQQVLEALIQALDHPNEQVRIIAAAKLIKVGNQKAVSVLIETFAKSDNDDFIDDAGKALTSIEIGSQQVLETLIQALDHPNEQVRIIAAAKLIKAGNQKAVSVLIEIFAKSDNDDLRALAKKELTSTEVGSQQVLEALIQALDHPNEKVRMIMAAKLIKVGNQNAVKVLIEIICEILMKMIDLEEVEKASPSSLSFDKDVIDNYKYFLTSRVIEAKEAFTSIEINNQQVIETLIKILDDSNTNVLTRKIVIDALAKIDSPQAFAVLIQSLAHSQEEVRAHTKSQLEDIRLNIIANQQMFEVLLQALDDPNEEVRHCVLSFLRELDYRVVIEEIRTKKIDCRATKILGKIGNPQVAEILVKTLNHSNDEIRIIVTSLLEKIGSQQAVEALVQALHNSSEEVTLSAIEELEKIGTKQACEGLVKALDHTNELDHPNEKVRQNVVLVLQKIGNKQLVDALIEHLSYADDDVRFRSSVEFLEENGNAETVTIIIRKPDLDIYRSDIFLLARKLAIHHSRDLAHPLTRDLAPQCN